MEKEGGDSGKRGRDSGERGSDSGEGGKGVILGTHKAVVITVATLNAPFVLPI